MNYKDKDYIKKILKVLYRDNYEQDEKLVQEIKGLYVGNSADEEKGTKIDYTKIDLIKITLLAYHYYHSFNESGNKFSAKELYKVIQGQSYIKRKDGKTLFLTVGGKTQIVNSDISIFGKKDTELEENYTEEELILLRGYSRYFPAERLAELFSYRIYDFEALKTFFGGENEFDSEDIYIKLLKTVKR